MLPGDLPSVQNTNKQCDFEHVMITPTNQMLHHEYITVQDIHTVNFSLSALVPAITITGQNHNH